MKRRFALKGIAAVTLVVAGGLVWRARDRGVFAEPEGEPFLPWDVWRAPDLKGTPLANVPVDIWHADGEGYYDSQKPEYATEGPSSRARFVTDADGRFFFRTILPCSYPIPTDGPVGEMIIQTRRHAMRPAHVHFLVNAPGYQPLITHVFMDGDKYLDSDVVFGVKDELVAKIERRTDAAMPDGKAAVAPWHLMTYEFRVKPGAGLPGSSADACWPASTASAAIMTVVMRFIGSPGEKMCPAPAVCRAGPLRAICTRTVD